MNSPPDPPPIVLASASPRRQALLAQLGVPAEVRPATVPELIHKPPGVSPLAWVMALAHFKARAVAEHTPDRWVLGADTIVICDTELLNKPRDADDARRMLQMQAGRATDVLTGVALLRRGGHPARFISAATTRVWMRDDPAELEAYVLGGDWAGKAGAYGLQDVGDRLVDKIEGSFSNVVGLPIELLSRMLARLASGADAR